MKKKIAAIALAALLLTTAVSCTILKRPIDNRSQFSRQLKEVEENINNGNWRSSAAAQNTAEKTWEGIKPLLQLDIDHDYVNDIEGSFRKLKAYIKARDKSNALAEIMLIQDLWSKIGEM